MCACPFLGDFSLIRLVDCTGTFLEMTPVVSREKTASTGLQQSKDGNDTAAAILHTGLVIAAQLAR